MAKDKILYRNLSYKIVGLAMQVHTELGFGFLERVYENALMVLYEENNLRARSKFRYGSHFTRIVGEYVADIVVEESIIVDLKALDRIVGIHKAQTLNYLKATQFRLALLINFGKHCLEYERLVF